ncbi:hypothetical protein MA16_Dca027379 [Dendrobium catenatum]|uniref:Uncharacterized protein n=1 Tax=Dendrobium catenatum TaxID=906689 RepID=A0A2I0V9R0_9ASPA|nr:hypothetical protein MA16_Dca027379 [Dendrobium catenatum]
MKGRKENITCHMLRGFISSDESSTSNFNGGKSIICRGKTTMEGLLPRKFSPSLTIADFSVLST